MHWDSLLQVFLTAMIPIGELRLSIPFGMYTLGLPWFPVLVASFLGNMVPVFPLILGLQRLSHLWVGFPKPIGRLVSWRVDRLRFMHSKRFLKYGPTFLVVLVAVPLPFTGAWTGCLAVWAFQIPMRTAIPLIALGVLLSAVIVTLLALASGQVGVILNG